MKFINRIAAGVFMAVAAIGLPSVSAKAAFLEVDLVAGSGDGLLIEDTTNGLQWFDWSQYPALTSVDDFFATGPVAGLGFRQATQADLEQLFTTAGADAFSYNAAWVDSPANAAAIVLLNSTTTHQSPWPDTLGNPWIHALFDNGGDPNTSGLIRFNSEPYAGLTGIIDIYGASNYENTREFDAQWSVMAVREIPVSTPAPATLTILGLGLAGLGLARRKRTT